jgi:hypothetical protein
MKPQLGQRVLGTSKNSDSSSPPGVKSLAVTDLAGQSRQAKSDFSRCPFIAQVSLYANSLGVAIAQSTYATDAGGELAALRQLLDRAELEGLLVQADALPANRPFFLPRTAWCRPPDCGETQPP